MRMKDSNNPKLMKGNTLMVKLNKKNHYFDDITLDHEALKKIDGQTASLNSWYKEGKSIYINVNINGVEWTLGINDVVIIK